MSGFLDDIIDVGSKLLGGDGLGATLAKTALAGYAINQLTNSTKTQDATTAAADPTNAAAVDKGVRQQSDASTDNRVPVVYGRAYTGGKIFDAYMTEDNTTMYFAIAICEKTSEYTINGEWLRGIRFEGVYWNNSRVVFDTDNTTVLSLYNESSGTTSDLGGLADASGGLVKIWLYNNGSQYSTITTDRWSPGSPYPSGNAYAYNVMPNWTSSHTCDQLVFAIVKVVYSKDKSVTGLGDLKFHINNPLSSPGDVLVDYMTNARYGGGVALGDVNL
jgi:hypothetical protein